MGHNPSIQQAMATAHEVMGQQYQSQPHYNQATIDAISGLPFAIDMDSLREADLQELKAYAADLPAEQQKSFLKFLDQLVTDAEFANWDHRDAYLTKDEIVEHFKGGENVGPYGWKADFRFFASSVADILAPSLQVPKVISPELAQQIVANVNAYAQDWRAYFEAKFSKEEAWSDFTPEEQEALIQRRVDALALYGSIPLKGFPIPQGISNEAFKEKSPLVAKILDGAEFSPQERAALHHILQVERSSDNTPDFKGSAPLSPLEIDILEAALEKAVTHKDTLLGMEIIGMEKEMHIRGEGLEEYHQKALPMFYKALQEGNDGLFNAAMQEHQEKLAEVDRHYQDKLFASDIYMRASEGRITPSETKALRVWIKEMDEKYLLHTQGLDHVQAVGFAVVEEAKHMFDPKHLIPIVGPMAAVMGQWHGFVQSRFDSKLEQCGVTDGATKADLKQRYQQKIKQIAGDQEGVKGFVRRHFARGMISQAVFMGYNNIIGTDQRDLAAFKDVPATIFLYHFMTRLGPAKLINGAAALLAYYGIDKTTDLDTPNDWVDVPFGVLLLAWWFKQNNVPTWDEFIAEEVGECTPTPTAVEAEAAETVAVTEPEAAPVVVPDASVVEVSEQLPAGESAEASVVNMAVSAAAGQQVVTGAVAVMDKAVAAAGAMDGLAMAGASAGMGSNPMANGAANAMMRGSLNSAAETLAAQGVGRGGLAAGQRAAGGMARGALGVARSALLPLFVASTTDTAVYAFSSDYDLYVRSVAMAQHEQRLMNAHEQNEDTLNQWATEVSFGVGSFFASSMGVLRAEMNPHEVEELDEQFTQAGKAGVEYLRQTIPHLIDNGIPVEGSRRQGYQTVTGGAAAWEVLDILRNPRPVKFNEAEQVAMQTGYENEYRAELAPHEKAAFDRKRIAHYLMVNAHAAGFATGSSKAWSNKDWAHHYFDDTGRLNNERVDDLLADVLDADSYHQIRQELYELNLGDAVTQCSLDNLGAGTFKPQPSRQVAATLTPDPDCVELAQEVGDY